MQISKSSFRANASRADLTRFQLNEKPKFKQTLPKNMNKPFIKRFLEWWK